MTKITYIPGEIANAAIDENGNRKPVTRTQHIFDDSEGKSQAEVNADTYRKNAVYNKEETNSIISRTPETDVVVLDVPEGGTAADALNAIPVADRQNKLFRVRNDTNTKYDEYGWTGSVWALLASKDYGIDDEPTAGSNNLVKSGGVKQFIDKDLHLLSLPMTRTGGTTDSKLIYAYEGTVGNLSSFAAAACYETIEIDVTGVAGQTIEINCNSWVNDDPQSTQGAWCLFVDSRGNVIERWQQNDVLLKTVPTNAELLKLSNIKYEKDGITATCENPSVCLTSSSIKENVSTLVKIKPIIETDSVYFTRNGGRTDKKLYYGYNDELADITTIAAAACLERIVVNVEHFINETLIINVDADVNSPSTPQTQGAWQLFVDANGNILERWQQDAPLEKVVPFGAKELHLSNSLYEKNGTTVHNIPYIIRKIDNKEFLSYSRTGGTTSSKLYYGYYGELADISYMAAAGCLERIDCSVEDYNLQKVLVKCYSGVNSPSTPQTQGAWCLFLDEDGNVIDRWQQENEVIEKVVPVGAKMMKLSNVKFKSNGTTPECEYPYIQILNEKAYSDTFIPEIEIPAEIHSYVGDIIQIFKYPLIKSSRYEELTVNMSIRTDNTSIRALGHNLLRYFEFTPQQTGTYYIDINIMNQEMELLAVGETKIVVGTPANPSSMKNILFMGDSETAGETCYAFERPGVHVEPDPDAGANSSFPYANEIKGLLTSNREASDVQPAGLNLTNYQLIGTRNTSGGRIEAVGGWNYSNFLGSGSPFYINGQIDLNAYLAQDTPYGNTSHKGIDYLYILLGANETIPEKIENGKLVFDMTQYKENVRTFLDIVKAQLLDNSGAAYYNPNLKVILLGYCYPWIDGSGYHIHGSTKYGGGTHNTLMYAAISMANDEISQETDYSSFVSSVRMAQQVDSENGYAWYMKQVNRYTAATEKVRLEAVHPNMFGYKMYANAVVRDILSR